MQFYLLLQHSYKGELHLRYYAAIKCHLIINSKKILFFTSYKLTMTLTRTNSDNADFQKLVIELDTLLRILDGDDHEFYAKLNKTDMIKHVVVAYENNEAVGCGAIRAYSTEVMEVKRMYVPQNKRGMGIATNVLIELEKWTKELGYNKCILETGYKQVEAIALYKKSGYKIIPNFGRYQNVENSICFEKTVAN